MHIADVYVPDLMDALPTGSTIQWKCSAHKTSEIQD